MNREHNRLCAIGGERVLIATPNLDERLAVIRAAAVCAIDDDEFSEFLLMLGLTNVHEIDEALGPLRHR